MGVLDSASFDVPCPGCGEKFEQFVGGLNEVKEFTCPVCGRLFKASDLAAGINESNKAADDFARQVKGFKLG